MIHKLLATVIFFFGFCGLSLAGGHLENEKTPERFIQYYFDAFNAQNQSRLDTVFTKPFQRVRKGEIVSYDSWQDFIDFDLIKNTGWKRSVINETQVIFNGDKTAIIRVSFSRLGESDEIVANGEVAYILIKPDSQWKIASALLPGSIPISKEDD